MAVIAAGAIPQSAAAMTTSEGPTPARDAGAATRTRLGFPIGYGWGYNMYAGAAVADMRLSGNKLAVAASESGGRAPSAVVAAATIL